MKRVYFVSYFFGKRGFGCAEVFSDKEIRSFEDIQDISRNIEIRDNITDVVILNYKELRQEARE